MTFNDDARIDTSKVQRRKGGRAAAIGGGSVIGVLVLYFASSLLGVDLTPLAGVFDGGSQPGSSSEQTADLSHCSTGAAANQSDECRMVAATDSIDTYWEDQVRGYRSPGMILYDGSTSSACGTASNAVGPFYCPSDESIYIDTIGPVRVQGIALAADDVAHLEVCGCDFNDLVAFDTFRFTG